MHSVTSNAVYSALYQLIKKKTITGTTNGNGILFKSNSNLDGTEIILNAIRTDYSNDVCLVGWQTGVGQWLEIIEYDLTRRINTPVTVDIYYL